MAVLSLPLLPRLTNAQHVRAREVKPAKTIVVGFVGGMRSHDDPTQGVVVIGERLKRLNFSNLQVRVYSHWHMRDAYRWIYDVVDSNADKNLTGEELRSVPKIVIYGHSLGGWAVINLSRKLEKKGIPVELTVQIDSVGLGDEVVPGNVKTAVNYYQQDVLLLHGEKRIRPADNHKTSVVGNRLIKGVGHKALAKQLEISDFITDKINLFCTLSTAAATVTIPSSAAQPTNAAVSSRVTERAP